MAVGADQCSRRIAFRCHRVHLKTFALCAGHRGRQGVALLRRFFDVVKLSPQRFSEQLEGGITRGAEVIEATFRFAGVGDVVRAASRTLHRQRLKQHRQLASIVQCTLKSAWSTAGEACQERHQLEVNAEHFVNRQGVQWAEERGLDIIAIALGHKRPSDQPNFPVRGD